ncbi:MAG: biotin--[acetyl-CoA-carboxylase] ligase [Bacteroidia bacterium]
MATPDMETLFIGRQRFELEELESTNAYAQELIKNGIASEGASVLVRNQTRGRGQRGASWESEPGKNLTVSIVLYPSFLPAHEQFFLSRITALALADMLRSIPGLDPGTVKIKWPNDIYAGDRKVAGILIENSWRGTELSASVVGVGLNINQESFHTAPQAASLKMLGAGTSDIRNVEENMYSCLEARYLQLRSGKKSRILSDYHALLYRLGEWHVYFKDGEAFNAIIEGVSDSGKLRLKRDDGSLREFDLKEIRYNNLS